MRRAHGENMIDDGTFRYVYDAWNRLVAVKSSEDDGASTGQTAEFDGRGRRLKKVVTDSGNYDGTVVYLFDGQKIIETRDGSGNVVQQFIHGTQYIDELVMMRVIDKGDLYIHQDANWNVIALTDLGGHVVERYVYTPYGEITVHADTGNGDRDGDQDVDSDDKGTPGSTCTGTVTGACRILDLDFDGDYDATDATKFDNLPQGIARHPGRVATAVDQPFGHQGLLYEPELGQYQNRARQYDPGKRRFVQRDPSGFATGPTDNRFATGLHYLDGVHLYCYEANTPGGHIDPSGFSAFRNGPCEDASCLVGLVTTSCTVTDIDQVWVYPTGCWLIAEDDILESMLEQWFCNIVTPPIPFFAICPEDCLCDNIAWANVNACVTIPITSTITVGPAGGDVPPKGTSKPACSITVSFSLAICVDIGIGTCSGGVPI